MRFADVFWKSWQFCLVALAFGGSCGAFASEAFLGVERARIEQIIDMGYRLDPATVGAIEALKEDYPESPVPELMEAGRLYWLQNYAEWDAGLKKEFEAAAERALDAAREHLKGRKDDPDAQFAEAMVEMMQVIYYVDHHRWWAAFWKTRSSLRVMRRLVKEYPDYHDAKLPLGMANCYLSKTPGYLKPLAFLMNFRGDWETGMRYMKEARDGGLFARVDAGYYLGGIYVELENDRERARAEFAKLVDQYPENVKFQTMLAELDRGLGRNEAARDRALQALDSPVIKRVPAIEGRALLSLLWSSLGAQDFQLTIETAQRVEQFVSRHEFLKAEAQWAAYARAEALLGLGARAEALELWTAVSGGDNPYAAAAARKRIEEERLARASGEEG